MTYTRQILFGVQNYEDIMALVPQGKQLSWLLMFNSKTPPWESAHIVSPCLLLGHNISNLTMCPQQCCHQISTVVSWTYISGLFADTFSSLTSRTRPKHKFTSTHQEKEQKMKTLVLTEEQRLKLYGLLCSQFIGSVMGNGKCRLSSFRILLQF